MLLLRWDPKPVLEMLEVPGSWVPYPGTWVPWKILKTGLKFNFSRKFFWNLFLNHKLEFWDTKNSLYLWKIFFRGVRVPRFLGRVPRNLGPPTFLVLTVYIIGCFGIFLGYPDIQIVTFSIDHKAQFAPFSTIEFTSKCIVYFHWLSFIKFLTNYLQGEMID